MINSLTVFLISSGTNPNYESCLKALKEQTVEFKLEIIKDFNPMSLAFQEMLNRCKTPYYIECDEDMVLEPEAIEKMYSKIINTPTNIAMSCFQLRDVHLDFVIYGVKIYKYKIFKNYPYNLKHISCEMNQLERIKADGYSYETIPEVVGLHSPCWAEELIFERYLNLMEKFKEYKYLWLEKVPSMLWGKIKKDPSDINIYALLGAYTSLSNNRKMLLGEKDFVGKRKEFKNMDSFIKPPVSGTLYLTNVCNFKCNFCYRNNNDVESFPDMTVKVVNDLIFKFPTIKSLCLCGLGEPFLCTNFGSILKYAKDKGIYTGIITNGSFIENNYDIIKYNRPGYISISLNYFDRENHRQFTGSDTFDSVLKGISMCVKDKQETYISCVCTKENLNKIPDIMSLSKKLGVKGLHLHNILPNFKEINNTNFMDLVLTNNDKDAIENLKSCPDSDIVSRYPILINKNEIRRECMFPWRHLNVNGNGSVSLCNSVFPPDRNNGTIYDSGPIWQNSYCQDFRDSIIGEQKDACKKCFRNWECD